jgi:2-amino-4-hydroxy-6-hydroxymethyldihydropteridine diphosphokinase
MPTTGSRRVPLDALLEAAAAGDLPAWTRAGEQRREHMRRVGELLGEWAAALGLSDTERTRWRAAGYLHDALREAPPEELRAEVPPELRKAAGKLLHGPAAAERLRAAGVRDESFLRAVTYHTIGHPDLDELGAALFIADYIEPGRRHQPEWLEELRARMPAEREEVLREVLRARLERLLRDGRPVRAETVALWNRLVGATAHA